MTYHSRQTTAPVALCLTQWKRLDLPFIFVEHHHDFVEIRDGEKDYSEPYLSPFGGFTGNGSYTVNVTSSNVMWIKFFSDGSVSSEGFNLTYEAVGKQIVLWRGSLIMITESMLFNQDKKKKLRGIVA